VLLKNRIVIDFSSLLNIVSKKMISLFLTVMKYTPRNRGKRYNRGGYSVKFATKINAKRLVIFRR